MSKSNSKLDRIAQKIPPDEIRSGVVKSKAIFMRVTASDKISIKKSAQRLRLSVSEYLTQLHHAVGGRI